MLLCEHSTVTRWERDEARRLFQDASKASLTYAKRHGIRPFAVVDLLNPRPGLRRWVVANTPTAEGEPRWKQARASIHFDGSVTVVFAVGGHRTQDGFQPGSLIDSAAVEGAVADFMGLVRTVGGHIGSVDYEIRVGIEWTGQDQMIMQTVDNLGFPCGNLHPDVPVQSGRGNDRNRNRRREIPARGANPHPGLRKPGWHHQPPHHRRVSVRRLPELDHAECQRASLGDRRDDPPVSSLISITTPVR
jgi:hypothetical protein